MRQILNTLYVMTPNAYVHLENETLRVEVEGEKKLQVPLHHLGSVVCFGDVLVSPALMHACAREADADADRAALDRAADSLAASIRALPVAGNLDTVRGIEGEAARTYFDNLTRLLRKDARAAFAMNGRSRRPPRA